MITASLETLMEQAAEAVDYYVAQANKEWSVEQKLRYAELCVMEYTANINNKEGVYGRNDEQEQRSKLRA